MPKRKVDAREWYPVYSLENGGPKTSPWVDFTQDEIDMIEEASRRFDEAQRLMSNKLEEAGGN